MATTMSLASKEHSSFQNSWTPLKRSCHKSKVDRDELEAETKSLLRHLLKCHDTVMMNALNTRQNANKKTQYLRKHRTSKFREFSDRRSFVVVSGLGTIDHFLRAILRIFSDESEWH